MSEATAIHRSLGHPVVDADGHFMEFVPVLEDEVAAYLEEDAGPAVRDRYVHQRPPLADTVVFSTDRSSASVVDRWAAQGCWWGNPVASALDRATAHLPQLMAARMEELGIDFMFLYPSWSLGYSAMADDELRAPVCRATNRYFARLFAGLRDRMEPAAVIPMHTPAEAVAEIDFAVGELGFKSVLLPNYARRPVPEGGTRLDFFGLDSPFDYDPVWEACIRNNVAPAFHSGLGASHPGRSITNYVYNHIHGFAGAHHTLCKSLFMGGVLHRFPELRVSFLEGGVLWAAGLVSDLVGHWEKRGGPAIGDLDPDRLDVDAVMAHLDHYGGAQTLAHRDAIRAHLARPASRPAVLDEFARSGVESVEDILEPFQHRLFFGCEADDPLIGVGVRLRLEGRPVPLQPLFGSDVSHWDVPVMSHVLPEAYELVEHGTLTPDEFRDFTFASAVRMHGGANPRFFDDTVLRGQVEGVLSNPA
jgi:predicted TIM-barrel fold metal-dependent hydrolase